MDTLQLVLIISLVAMALINAACLLWMVYLDRRLRGRPTPKHYDVHVEGTKVFPEVDLKTVEAKAEDLLAAAVTRAADKLQASLDKATDTMAKHIQEVATSELEKYHANLQTLSQQNTTLLSRLQDDITKRRTVLLQQLDTDIAAEKEKRMDAFNARLSDIVASYLMESLGSQVDLGAEAPYIFEVLATHKDEIKRDVLS